MTDQPGDDGQPREQPVPVHGRLINISGGANLKAEQIEVGGDVVGRDKIIGGDEVHGDQQFIEVETGGVVITKGGLLAHISLPRNVQIAIGVVALAVIVLVIKAVTPASAKVNTEFIFDASAAMAASERWPMAQTVFGDQATYATRREQLALRTIGGGCDVPAEPLVPLGANQADRLVQAAKDLKPNGDGALVDSIKAAADDLPADADAQNTIILISAGEDACLTKQQKDPCAAMSAAADALQRAGIKFTLHIVALRANEAVRHQLTCLAHANATSYVYQANSVDDLKNVLKQIDDHTAAPQIAESWPLVKSLDTPPLDNFGWSPDGKQLLVQSEAGLLSWNIKSGRVITTSTEHFIGTGVWSPDGQQLAYIGGSGYINIWRNGSAAPLKSNTANVAGASYSLAWSPDGQRIATGSLNGTIPLWNVASQTAKQLAGHSGAVFIVAWSPDGKQLASSGGDGTIRLWDVASGQALHVMQEGCCGAAGLAWSPDGKQLASSNRGIHIWDAATGQLSATITTQGYTRGLRWSSDGDYIATASFEIIDVRSQQSLGSLVDSFNDGYQGIALSWSPDGAPDGVQVAIGGVYPQSSGNRHTIRVWQVPGAAP